MKAEAKLFQHLPQSFSVAAETDNDFSSFKVFDMLLMADGDMPIISASSLREISGFFRIASTIPALVSAPWF